jgi:hypothetical protein
MPLEGHYQRVNTPLRKLRRREITVLVVGSVVTLVAVLALLFVPGSTDHPLVPGANEAGSGCIEVAVAGRVGSEPVTGCGVKAQEICSRAAEFHNPRADTIGEACRTAGVKF